MSSLHTSIQNEIDVAVIGGGISGMYSADRLNSLYRKQGQPKNIHVFEATGRVGGRLYTVFFPGMEHVPVELGGMRFRESHRRVMKLVDDLGLTKLPFSDAKSGDEYDDPLYLRGEHLLKSHQKDTLKLPYKLREHERGKSVSASLNEAISKVVPDFEKLSKEEWKAQRTQFTYDGKPLKDISRMTFLASHFSPEFIELLMDTGELGTKADMSLLYYLDSKKSGDSGATYKVLEGYQSLPLRVAEKFKQEGGQVHMEHTLTKVAVSSNAEGIKTYRLTFKTGDDKVEYTAKKLILSLPPAAIMKLLPKTPLAKDERFKRNLESVTPVVLTKLFLAYREPWWRDIGGLKGESALTTLPVKNVYYFSSEADFHKDVPGEQRNRCALLMASYTQGLTDFWAALNRGPVFTQDMTRQIAPVAAGVHAVKEAQRELKVLHQKDDIPEPFAAVFQNWGLAPHHGGFCVPNVGFDPAVVDREIRKPSDEHDIYVFSSDYCLNQGWVESTLEIAESCLQQYFGETGS